jgi:Ni,Fe-hydrogenase maturation factor
MGHVGDPRALLALTEIVYDRRPEAWLITVPARDVAFGVGLSAATEQGAEEALRQVRLLASDCHSVPEEGEACTKLA